MLEIEEPLAQMRAAWMAGRPALEHCPPAWRPAIGEDAAAETALTALVGHAVQALFRPTAPAALKPRPLLPRLGAPTPPPAARSRVRRLLAGKVDPARLRGMVQLAAARGYVIHPADWTPAPGDDWAPSIYAPWLAWAAAEQTQPHAEALTLATYDDWPWAERRAELMALRRRDPAAARAIVQAKAPAEPAERRVKLVEILEDRLEPADASFLESLAADRSDRVQTLSRRLLARLGHGMDETELAAELAAMVELGKTGLIKRRHQLKLRALKTQAQESRRRELFGLVTLPQLARALGVEAAALVETAPAGDTAAALRFAELVAETGSDAARRALLEKVLDDADAPLGIAVPLAARAAPEERAAVLPTVMARETVPTFQLTLLFAGDALGGLSTRALSQSAAHRAFGDLLRAAGGGDEKARVRADEPLRTALTALGLLLDAGAAQGVVEACATAGLSPADPRLDLLHLNAALNPERPT